MGSIEGRFKMINRGQRDEDEADQEYCDRAAGRA